MHTFHSLGVSLPRSELARRSQYVEANRLYHGNAWQHKAGHSDSAHLCVESRCSASLRTVAIVDAGDLCLALGERAVVPARWYRRVPEDDFRCEESSLSQVSVEPGFCLGRGQETMLCVVNESMVDVTLERGAPLAEAHEWVIPRSAGARSAEPLPRDEVKLLLIAEQ